MFIKRPRILIVGHGRHGKTTAAQIIEKHFGLTHEDSSMAAARIFIYDKLKDKYGYSSFEECYNDRSNHRSEWYDLIRAFNKKDNTKLAREIMKSNDVYCGMRSIDELRDCRKKGVFDFVIGVVRPDEKKEPSSSFDSEVMRATNMTIFNSGDMERFEESIVIMMNNFLELNGYINDKN